MEFLKTRNGAALILAIAVAFGTLYGSRRSLTAEGKKITAQNEMVMKDLSTRIEIGENLYTVAGRYLSGTDLDSLRQSLDFLAQNDADVMGYIDLAAIMRGVFYQMSTVDTLTEQDAKYLSGFEAQLESGVSTIARDPYTIMAAEYNDKTLQGFPANILGRLTGVKELPVSQ